jgi:transposase
MTLDRAPGLGFGVATLEVGLCLALSVAEVADIRRFKTKDAFARHNGTAPLPVWSDKRRPSPTCAHRQPPDHAAIHRIAITQARCRPDGKVWVA